MNKFEPSQHKFAFVVAGSVLAASLYLILIASSLNQTRHNWVTSLVSTGAKHTGTTQLAWYELAHVLAPRNPAVGFKLAGSYQAAGDTSAAVNVLAHYPLYLDGVILEGQLLMQKGESMQAAAALKPVVRENSQAAYWDAQALAEQGSATQGWQVLRPFVAQGSTQLVVLYDYLRLAAGQGAVAAVSGPEAAQAVSNAALGKYQLAAQLYHLRLLNTSERVLSSITEPSAASWVLRAAIAASLQPAQPRAEEAAYWQALILDPTDTAVKAKLVDLAKQLGDQPMLNQVARQQAQLPVR